MAKIKKIITYLESPNGQFHGFRLTRCSDGAQVEAQTTGGASNIKSALTNDGTQWVQDYYSYTETLREKELFALPHAGCDPEDIRTWVKKNLKKPKR